MVKHVLLSKISTVWLPSFWSTAFWSYWYMQNAHSVHLRWAKTKSKQPSFCWRTVGLKKHCENLQGHLVNGPNWNIFNSFQGKANNKFYEDFLFQLIGSLRMREVEFKPHKPQKTAFTIKRTQASNTCLKPDWQSDIPLQLPYWACCNAGLSV